MKRLFWMGLGVAVTIAVVVKGKQLLYKATPQGISDQVSATSKKAGNWLTDFVADVKDAMAEREDELNEALGRVPQVEASPRRAGA